MTIEGTATRPYRVLIRALDIDLFHRDGPRIRSVEFVDAGLNDRDAEALNPDLKRPLFWAKLSTQVFVLLVAMSIAVVGAINLFLPNSNPVLGVLSLVLAAGIAAATYRGSAYLKATHRDLRRVQTRLKESGLIFDLPLVSIEARRDLSRIEAALHTLQDNCGQSFDSAARNAVAAVLQRHRHMPSEQQQKIAKTAATDENTVLVREHVNSALTRWNEDVATAEALMLKLELDAEASKAETRV